MSKSPPKLFYLQDSRQYVGNDMLFWRKGHSGYTTDIKDAELFTTEEALKQYRSRKTDIPWNKNYIDNYIKSVVDHQTVRFQESMEGSGIRICPEIPEINNIKKECRYCGRYIIEEGKHEIEIEGKCKKCREPLYEEYEDEFNNEE